MSVKDDLRRMYLRCREEGILVDPHVAYVAIQAVGDYSGIRSRYNTTLQNILVNALFETVPLSTAKTEAKKIMATSFLDAFETGWTQTGGDPYEPDPEDNDWLASRLNQELANIDSLFSTIKGMLKPDEEPLSIDELNQFATDRANGYSATLDNVFANGKMRGKKSVMLTFTGTDGNESCKTCQKHKGKRHRAKWWIKYDLIPAPGNEMFECGGWQCQHYLEDDQGNQWAGVQA